MAGWLEASESEALEIPSTLKDVGHLFRSRTGVTYEVFVACFVLLFVADTRLDFVPIVEIVDELARFVRKANVLVFDSSMDFVTQ